MAKKRAAKKSAAKDEPAFEESLAELESVVEDLEGGELPLADALARYEEGVARLKACHAQLEAAERRIELLSGVDAEGNPVVAPFDDTPSADAPGERSAKRSASVRRDASGGVDGPPGLF
ncbi:MAG: exodeoxyribonuclease VII small subunit [Planctomycetota bacterium]